MLTNKLVVANWKQNKTLDEAVAWCKEFGRLWETKKLEGVTVVVCPPMAFLEKAYSLLYPLGVTVGVQDVSAFEDGAHTGFVGVNQVKHFIKYSIVGHSERAEDRETVVSKAKRCLESGITPIVCFESADQYKIMEGAVYALEDPENISQNGVYRSKGLAEVQNLVDGARKFFGQDALIIYGGSVNQENAPELSEVAGLNGVLVGHASLNPATFYAIVSKFFL